MSKNNTRTLRVDLEIEVRALTKAELSDEGFDPHDEPADLEDLNPFDVAEVVVGMFHEEAIQEAFAGSGLFVTFKEDPLLIAYEWVSA